ncbi:MAG: DUF2254 domain-containing protein [Burkholderiaceae bacterium]
MRARLLKYWEYLRASFWFLPSLMAAAAVGMALLAVLLDRTVSDKWLSKAAWVYSGGAEGASAVLQTIAGSMITIAGVVFSLTLVALSLASSQFGPRLLRNFMRDTSNQLVLGTFIATFLYCMLVLRTIRRPEEGAFVPHVAVTMGVVFALASLWVLIYFIHHVSVSIQAEEVIAKVAAELDQTMERLFPEQIGGEGDSPGQQEEAASAQALAALEQPAAQILASGDGYLQLIDQTLLMAFASESDAVLRLERRPGHYIVHGTALLSVWPPERVDKAARGRLLEAFVLGTQRTSAQDVEFAILQLVEIATRALSPGVNDPFTAISCVDRIGSAMCRLAQRAMPSAYRYDDKEQLRVVAEPPTFAALADTAFHQLRQYARSNVDVTLRLLETITVIAGFTHWPDDRVALSRHADMIAQGAERAEHQAEDRQALQGRYHAARRALGSQDMADAGAGASRRAGS